MSLGVEMGNWRNGLGPVRAFIVEAEWQLISRSVQEKTKLKFTARTFQIKRTPLN